MCTRQTHTQKENVRFAWSSSSGCASVSDCFASVRLSLQSFSQQLKLTLFRGNRQFELSCDLSVIFKSVATSKLNFSQIQIQTFCMSVQFFSITHTMNTHKSIMSLAISCNAPPSCCFHTFCVDLCIYWEHNTQNLYLFCNVTTV